MDEVAACLILRYGKTNHPEYILTDRPITLGREAINDVVLGDPEISRRHARIFYQDGTYYLEDLGSTNGTFINGRRVHAPSPLQDEDMLEFGESIRLQFFRSGVMDQDQVTSPVIELEARPSDRPGPTRPLPGDPPPPPALPATDTDLLALPEEPARKSNWRRTVFGCGCLVLVVAFICVFTVFILDSQFPNVLYCGPLRGFFELIQPLTCPILP
jgi:predicted component of type VI protein secretion system